VLCITHLPQIAASADTHYRIEKVVGQGRTATRVARLDRGARVEEIGRMLGGSAITDAIRRSAREMLETRARRPPAGEGVSKGESERAKAKAARRN
jgi:DNA repair protein RecN (Recombination protein N)